MKRALILPPFIIGLFMLAWWIGYAGFGGQDHTNQNAQPFEAVNAQGANNGRGDNPVAVLDAPDYIDLDSPEGAVASLNNALETTKLATNKTFKYIGWKIDDTGDLPKACLHFNDEIAHTNLEFTDYIEVQPKAPLRAEINGKTACLSGLKFAQTYQLSLRTGLKGAAGHTLKAQNSVEISFGSKPPHIKFAGNGVILPRIGAQGLAIETMNIDLVKAEIFSVSDRMLARRDISAGKTTEEGDYSYEYSDAASQIRRSIWKGDIRVKNLPNTTATTVLPLQDLVGPLQAGAYIISVKRGGDEEDYPARAWRWVIVTDLAMTSYKGNDGLTLSVRSIDSAKTQPNVKLDLIAQNNDLLASVKTNASGHAFFPKALLRGRGVRAPRMVMAYDPQGDFAMLDFNRSPLDLAAFPIGGRSTSGEIDAYVYTDRGVYRPGHTVHVSAQIRDQAATAIKGRKGHIRYLKPNGLEFLKHRFDGDQIDAQAGMFTHEFHVPKSAPRGVWRIQISLDGMKMVGKSSFSVEDFVPQKLRVDVKIDKSPMRADEIRPLSVSSQFLYGANGSGLEAEAEARLRLDPSAFPDFKKYQFGRADETFKEVFKELGSGVTDGDGLLELGLSFKDENIRSTRPLRALISVGAAEPGGRYVKNSTYVPVRTQSHYLGIKPSFENRPERNASFSVDFIAVDWQGKSVTMPKAEWILVEEDWHYNWYREHGRWKYRREVRDIEISRGNVDVLAQTGAQITKSLDWGRYRLIIKDENGGSEASYQFSVGWRGGATSDTPDQIAMGVPTGPSQNGDSVNLTINAPYAGVGELVLAGNKVHTIKNVKIKKGGSEISVKLDKDMGEGVYALLSLYAPRDIKNRPVPRRAVGIGYLEIDQSARKLSVKISDQAVLKPRRKHAFDIQVDNIPNGERAWVSVAAVDEGILQITKFKSPDLQKWYFDKKAFGLDMRDDYSRLLNPNLGQAAIAKSGGDSLGGEGLTSVPQKTVSLYHKPVKVKNGRAHIEFDVPDFNGELRVMVSAWSRSAVGQDVQAVKVRDAVPAIVSLPRFLAPNDQAKVSVSLDNIDGVSGAYAFDLSGSKGLGFLKGEPAGSLALKQGERKTGYGTIVAKGIGMNTVNFAVKGPSKYQVKSNYDLQTRSPFFPITTTVKARMEAGEIYTIANDLGAGLDPATLTTSVSFSSSPFAEPSSFLKSLNQYPYGCTEQTVSKALPLLYAKDLGADLNDTAVRRRVQVAIERLQNRQSSDGAFGLWRAGDRYAQPWIGVYATDFLIRAKQNGYVVNDATLESAYQALKTITKMQSHRGLKYAWRTSDRNRTKRKIRHAEAAAYAHYLLASNGRSDLSSLRYFYDNHMRYVRSSLGHGHIGGALWMMNDKTRASEAFDDGQSRLAYNYKSDYYQSPTRDGAGLLTILNEISSHDKSQLRSKELAHWIDPILQKYESNTDLTKYFNTQEKAHLIMAFRSFTDTQSNPSIQSNAVKMIKSKGLSVAYLRPEDIHLNGKNAEKIPSFTNKSSAPVWRTISIYGTPLSEPAPVEENLTAVKSIFTMTGERVSGNHFQQGQKYIVRVEFGSTTKRNRQMVMADLLPAGMEIEAVLRPKDGARKDGQEGAFEWLGTLANFQTIEKRDDRMIAVAQSRRTENFVLAYVVRAVTQGDFIWPGVMVEDMYRPQDMARTKSRRAVIGNDQKG